MCHGMCQPKKNPAMRRFQVFLDLISDIMPARREVTLSVHEARNKWRQVSRNKGGGIELVGATERLGYSETSLCTYHPD
jgi:hypothetical protein